MTLRPDPLTSTPRASDEEIRHANAEQKEREIEACKTRLAEWHGLERDAKFEIAWRIAKGRWEGRTLSRMARRFDALAELLK